MTNIFKFNINSNVINKNTTNNYIPEKKQNLLITDTLCNTIYNNEINNNCKTNVKQYTFYNVIGKEIYTQFEIFLFEDNVLSYLLLKSVNDGYIKPYVKYNVSSFNNNGIFSNIQSVFYEFNLLGF